MSDEQKPVSVRAMSFNWDRLGIFCAVLMAFYNIASPAAAYYENGRDEREATRQAIKQILAHQQLQDIRQEKTDAKVDNAMSVINAMDKNIAVIASKTDAMWAWIKSGGEKVSR